MYLEKSFVSCMKAPTAIMMHSLSQMCVYSPCLDTINPGMEMVHDMRRAVAHIRGWQIYLETFGVCDTVLDTTGIHMDGCSETYAGCTCLKG